MGATYSPRPELVFPDPFDTIRAAMPGAKLAAEADAIWRCSRFWQQSVNGRRETLGAA